MNAITYLSMLMLVIGISTAALHVFGFVVDVSNTILFVMITLIVGIQLQQGNK